MIGVIANPTEHVIVREFFELFKTPWEFYRRDKKYEVLLCCGEADFDKNAANVVLIYAGQKLRFDSEEEIDISSVGSAACILYHKARMPIYGDCVTFRAKRASLLVDERSQLPTSQLRKNTENVTVRIGYNLFAEVGVLLKNGQPAVNAAIPTLELHIGVLRDLILASGVSLAEIPPVPDGYQFIACLTHDVDHPSIRQHKFDHTMFGFLYRATLGSLINLFRRRGSGGDLLRNLAAALKLPLVHLGLVKDIWAEFERYVELENGLPSSFFVIPFKDCPGRSGRGPAPSRRAARYGAADIAVQVRKLMSAGCEIGVHGIDAWLDSSSGRKELEQIRAITGSQEIGVRMHWLYFDEQSPATLERAGADYDSTVGYNETVGYRAGTAQAYKPLGATRLLELPLHIMDTALFFPGHLDLSPKEAGKRVGRIIDNAVQFGGTVTVNWHDRSVAPERCWGDFYVGVLDELKRKRAWFATAEQAVSWFRRRRSAVFEDVRWEPGAVCVKVAAHDGDHLPGLRLRVHKARELSDSGADSPEGYLDRALA